MSKKALPIEHISYSACVCFLRNRYEFKRHYIDKKYRDTSTPAMIVGSAFHKCLEKYYGGSPIEQALEAGSQLLRDAEGSVDWGKTGIPEKAESDYRQTVKHYFDEDPFYEKQGSLVTEHTMEAKVKGISIPLKAISDLIIDRGGMVYIIDFKKVQSLTDLETALPPAYMIQAFFNYHTFKAVHGTAPLEMSYHEVKTGVNKDKTNQTQCRTIHFDEVWERYWEPKLRLLVNGIIKEVGKKYTLYLPNISDMFTAEENWAEWLEELTTEEARENTQ